MPCRGEQVNGIKPLLQGRVRSVEDGASLGIYLITAPTALVGRMTPDPMKLPMLAALRAIQRLAVMLAHQEVQAPIIVRELLEKLLCGCCLYQYLLRCYRLYRGYFYVC